MHTSRLSRWLVWTGPAFAVLFYVVAFALQGETPGEKASGTEIVDYYNSHTGRTLSAVFLSPLAATLLVLFFSYLRTEVRERKLRSGPGPTVMISGAVLWASALLWGSVLELTLATSADNAQPAVAQTISVLSNMAWLPFIAGIAVTMIGAGMTVLTSRILPSWLGWVALVAGVISLIGPGGFVGWFVSPAWVLVAGLMLALRSTPATPPVTPSGDSVPPQEGRAQEADPERGAAGR